MNENEVRSAMDAWQALCDKRMASSERKRTDTEQLSMLRQALVAVEPYLVPRRQRLPQRLREIVGNWQLAWTRELRESDLWTAAKSKLRSIRTLIRAGDLDEADWQIRELLLENCSGVQALLASMQTRTFEPPNDEEVLTDEEMAEGMQELVDWLSRV